MHALHVEGPKLQLWDVPVGLEKHHPETEESCSWYKIDFYIHKMESYCHPGKSVLS